MRKKLYLSIIKRLQQLIIKDGEVTFISAEALQEMKDNNEKIEYAIKWNNRLSFRFVSLNLCQLGGNN